MQTIIIGTTPNSPWLRDCLDSIGSYDTYPIQIIEDETWELGKFKQVLADDRILEFFFLPDSTVVLNPEIFDLAFNCEHSYALSEGFKMYMGKYQRSVLTQMELPTPTSKEDAVRLEYSLNQEYLKLDPHTVVCPEPLEDSSVFIERNGRTNMVLENQWIRKYKGTWRWEQVHEL
jgi:hypothetical protein